jgi:transforming growth factor-beta-induced protein
LLPPSLVDEEGRATFRDLVTIADLLSDAPEFSTFISAITENGLLDTLAGDAPYTVFAPTNDAFLLAQSDMPADMLSVLQMHIVPGRVTVEELGNRLAVSRRAIGTLETLGGATITYQLSADGTIILNGQGISSFTTDVLVDNGVIHYIGNVMLPQREDTVTEFIRTSTDFTILERALEATNMATTLEGEGLFTVFAPTDDAFTDLADRLNITVDELLSDTEALTTILQFHVLDGSFSTSDMVTAFGGQADNVLELATLSGEELTLQATAENELILNGQGINVFLPDVVITNGLIQGIGGVMIPPSLVDENGLPTFGNFNSVMDVLNRDSSSFSSFVGLLEDNNLAPTLSGIGQFTVFAPTNGALLAAQSNLANFDMAEVVGFHVVEGRYTAQDLADLFALEDDNILELTTLSGEELWLQVDDAGTIFLNAQGITAIITDLSASNGIVHAISGVLLP